MLTVYYLTVIKTVNSYVTVSFICKLISSQLYLSVILGVWTSQLYLFSISELCAFKKAPIDVLGLSSKIYTVFPKKTELF